MLILEKVDEDREFRERDRAKLESQKKEAARSVTGKAVVLY